MRDLQGKKGLPQPQQGAPLPGGFVRSTHHECPVHYNGATAVEVTEAPVSMLISADKAIVNSKIKIEFSCNKTDCGVIPFAAPTALSRREVRGRGRARERLRYLRQGSGFETGRSPAGIIPVFPAF